jgi:protein TonB
MFAESMLETSWAQRSRRSWTTVTSFGLQAVVVGVMIAIPLLTTVGVPLARVVSTPLMLGRRDPGPAPTTEHARSSGVQIISYAGRLMAPGRIPSRVDRSGDTLPSGPDLGPTIPGAVGPALGPPSGFPLPMSGTRPIMPVIAAPNVRQFRTSTMLQGSLIHRVEPVYPPLAIAARVQGPVVLEAIISKAGTIEDLRLISGRPLLVRAALTAVSQWRYKPYILNGEVIEVETQITVNFVLGN